MYWQYAFMDDFSREAYAAAYSALTPSRRTHIDRLRLEKDKQRSLAAELLLKRVLREHCGITDVQLHRAENGRPYLTGCDLFVSLSHCEDLVACAVSTEPVGIDAERIRPIKRTLPDHVCTEDELQYVQEGDSLHRFFEIWTAKEAYFKKCGTGITSLKSVSVLPLKRQLFCVGDYLVQIM